MNPTRPWQATLLGVSFTDLGSELGRFIPSLLNCSDRAVRLSLNTIIQRAQASHFRSSSTLVTLCSALFD
ncbi:MAG: hypothetical protein ACI9OU_002380 [Candidatus Promineifilaceae bacterium]|jgi:hypothetical protein